MWVEKKEKNSKTEEKKHNETNNFCNSPNIDKDE